MPIRDSSRTIQAAVLIVADELDHNGKSNDWRLISDNELIFR